MECCRKLRPARRAAAARQLIRLFALAFLLAAALFACAQSSSTDSVPSAKQLAEPAELAELAKGQRWEAIVRFAEQAPAPSAELNYYYGISLAHLGRLPEARAALRNGWRLQPNDQRFAIELAGVEFKEKRYSEAARWLRRALALDPADDYANNFLGTVYFLEGNLEAALKYWNRAGRPQIANLRMEPEPRTNPVLIDRAFAFAPASTLRLEDYLTTQGRIRALQVFPSYAIDLAAREDGKFDATFRGRELNGWGPNKWMGALAFFRGIFQQTVYPEYFNIGGSAMNFNSLVRWDSQKRRFMAAISGPWRRWPEWRYRIATDLRNENWDVRTSFTDDASQVAALNLRKQVVEAEIAKVVSGRWSWRTGVELSHRDFRDLALIGVPASGFPAGTFSSGFQLKQLTGVNYELWRVPERRFTLNAGASSELARLWSEPGQAFAKLKASLAAHWLPQAKGDDYEALHRLRAGHTLGDSPFDELFMLGIERDNDLWLRAHVGTHDGRKGSAPLGRSYFLSNWELDKNLYRSILFKVSLGPFVDTGKILSRSPGQSTNKWLWDTGAQAKLEALGFGLAFVYGKDLRSGNNAFYTTVSK